MGRERLEQLYGHAKVVVTQTLVGRAYLLQEAHQRNCGERERGREDRVTVKQSTIMKLLNLRSYCVSQYCIYMYLVLSWQLVSADSAVSRAAVAGGDHHS